MVPESTVQLTGILEDPNTNGKEISFTVYQGYTSPAFQRLAILLIENTHMKC